MEKVAVVTGTAKGLGKALALTLADCEFSMVVHYQKSQKEAQEVLREVRKKSPKSIIVSGDLRDEQVVSKIFEEIFAKLGRVDILVNNVGNFLFKDFSLTSNEEFRDIVESNLYTSLFCSRAVLPFMRKVKSGHIINIGAVGAENITLRTKSIPYFIAKNAIYFLTKAMAHEEAKNGIHINMISPASLKTDIFKPSDFPMGRSATYADVTKTLLFLISDDAYYINGANIEVAGGFIVGMR